MPQARSTRAECAQHARFLRAFGAPKARKGRAAGSFSACRRGATGAQHARRGHPECAQQALIANVKCMPRIQHKVERPPTTRPPSVLRELQQPGGRDQPRPFPALFLRIIPVAAVAVPKPESGVVWEPEFRGGAVSSDITAAGGGSSEEREERVWEEE